MAEPLPARIGQLRLRDLTLLELLDELGSMTEVAAGLHVTQSAITQALHSLEQSFGTPLVLRGRRGQRGVRLSPAGSAALTHLRVARQALMRSVAAVGHPGRLDLRVGAMPLALVRPLPDALARLRRRIPQVRVWLTEGTVPNLWRQLEAGEVGSIVCRLPAAGARLPEGIAHRTVGHESMVLVCGRNHPVAHRRRPSPALLRAYDWILQPEGSNTRLAVDRMFLRAGLSTPEPAIVSMSFHANLRLVAGGTLLAVAPRAAAMAMREVLDLVLIPIEWSRSDAAVTLAWREDNLGNPALAAWLECFQAA